MNDIVTEHPAPAEAPEPPPPVPRRAAAKRAAREERLARVALEFQPDAIEIERRPPPLGARASLYLLLAFIVCMVVWAGVSNVERIVTARGKLVTSAPTMVVQPLDTSVVRSVRVTPGQVVRKGDVLATLDPTFTEADVSTLQGNLSAYAAQIWRLQAEVEGRPFKAADAGDSHDAQLQESIHVKRTAEFRARLRAMDERISGLEAAIRNAQEQRRLLSERLGTLREVEAIRTELFEKQRSSRITMLDARNARLQVERDLDAVSGKGEEARFDLASARAEREALDQEWRQQAAQQLADARREYNAILSQLEKAQRRNEMVQLEAPADGIVLEVADRSVGSVIRQAEAIVTLVPLEVPLEAEAMIDARDIGNIHAEADVRIKLDAFPYQKHGTLRGVLRTVSEDAFTDRERRGEQSFYRARISLAPGELSAVSPDFRLIPGMAVTAEIKVGERTILSYFLYPLMRGLDESIREP